MHFYQLRNFLSALALLLFLVSCSSQRVASSSKPRGGKRPPQKVATPPKAVAVEEVEVAEEPQKPDQVITAARAFLGTPYRYGGIDRKGIDCSGLLVCSFKTIDVTLPRTSAEQSNYGKAVSIHELKPGDLVFFAANKWKGRISHAGMVTEVRGKDEVLFIHSSSSKGVVESNLFSPYYRNIFVKARRPF